MQPLAFIPSPSQGVWHLGPIPIRAYAIMIILGIVVAVWLGERRWAAKGGSPGVIIDVAVWAVPFGLVGGRLYHVVTDAQRYFGADGDPVRALMIWEGGLGIWGAVALGAVGALIGCRRRGISVLALGDAVAPGIALAQAIGRWGNYWNQELYGRPLDTFWALKIDYAHRPTNPDGTKVEKYADIATYHPTFLYESLWCIGVAVLVLWADRRWKLTHGRAFALYVAAYTVGRFWIEWLRIDDAHHFLGLRLNDWTSIVVFLGAAAFLYVARGKTGPENVGAAEATAVLVPDEKAEGEPEAKDAPVAEGEQEPAQAEAEDPEQADAETDEAHADAAEPAEAVTETEQPDADTDEAQADAEEPEAEPAEPVASTDEPMAESGQADTGTDEPVAETDELQGDADEPVAAAGLADAETDESRADAAEPQAETDEPEVETDDAVTETGEVVAETGEADAPQGEPEPVKDGK